MFARLTNHMMEIKEDELVPWQIKIKALICSFIGVHLQVKSLLPREFTVKPCPKYASML
jgi:hypothetical protein